MKMPQAYINAGVKQDVKPGLNPVNATKIEARIDMGAEVAGAGLCPDCKKPMQVMTAGPIETNTCMGCRISLPLPDDVPAVEEQSQVNL